MKPRRLEMSTTTIEDELAEARGRIVRLQELERSGHTPDPARIRRHLDVLHRNEAAVRAAVRNAPDEVEGRLAQLRTRLNVAEYSLAADLSDDWASFSAAVEEELRSWDTYLERLQADAAVKAWKAREQAEAAIGDVRSRRIELDAGLTHARGDASGNARQSIAAARDELERSADELSARVA
jgi:hypothetical protein